ncbi:alanine racemase [Bacillus pumilus]|uniref:alanine racemase n=1 Tax=Bacillus pumilus TaxID=1408 RepID=UPI000D0437B7|nr:alanine racemase [Bacillus pumilus]MCY7502463.1 alanine racemase [Bacillus pumilus]MCY7528073.1 alanine racemase [Bacillus pumilus]MED4439850.1 alanine racemase [Bacillus pumilus]MED4492379.1 alanine racemase [Bacillus pumilus]PRS33891.1 alanine racemase [Bacillus pumilus]
MKKLCREVWIEVNLDAIKRNIEAIQAHIPRKSKIMAVVKANAYGHGSVEVARQALESGATELAVASLEEGIVLRRAKIEAPILVLGFTPLDCVKRAAAWRIDLSGLREDWIVEANEILAVEKESHRRLGIHVNVDTGMGRLGVRTKEELLGVVEALEKSENLRWDGIFTHFSTADEPDPDFTLLQHSIFIEFLRFLKKQGIKLPTVHMNNTAAAIAFPEFSADMIRLGIGLYGLYPSQYIESLDAVQLEPALSLKARIAFVKEMVTEPRTVSYGATYVAKPDEVIATIPIGYADGYSRALSNRGFMLFRGKRMPIAGRVTMDMTMISLGEMKAKQGEEVVIYGRQKGGEISVDEIAEMLNTINYEVIATLSRRVPRFYRRGGKIIKISTPVMYV